MNPLYEGIIDSAMRRYGVPPWLKPYIYKYARESDAGAIRQAISFINVRRRKGELTGRHVKLPNGVVFEIKDVIHVIDQFHYGLEATAKMARDWAEGPAEYGYSDYKKYFSQVSRSREKQARAMRNLVEGLGYRVGEPTKEIKDVFGYMAGLSEWRGRITATNLIIRDAYSRPFGFIFYRVFYPVSPEFMRSLGKVFSVEDAQSAWADARIRELVSNSAEDSRYVVELSETMLRKVYWSIQREMRFASSIGALPEAKLLRDISIAYPLHSLAELGADIDVQREVARITGDAKED